MCQMFLECPANRWQRPKNHPYGEKVRPSKCYPWGRNMRTSAGLASWPFSWHSAERSTRSNAGRTGMMEVPSSDRGVPNHVTRLGSPKYPTRSAWSLRHPAHDPRDAVSNTRSLATTTARYGSLLAERGGQLNRTGMRLLDDLTQWLVLKSLLCASHKRHVRCTIGCVMSRHAGGMKGGANASRSSAHSGRVWPHVNRS